MSSNKKNEMSSREIEAIEYVASGKDYTTQIVRGGNNSRIIRLKTNDNQKDIALKFYRNKKGDKLDRQRRESRFIKIALETNAKKYVPSIFKENEENEWTAFYWINGKPLKEIKESHIRVIADFIEELNRYKFRKNEKEKDHYAVDALTTSDNLISDMKKRIEDIVESPAIPGKEEFRNWMVNEVIKKGITTCNTVNENIKQIPQY